MDGNTSPATGRSRWSVPGAPERRSRLALLEQGWTRRSRSRAARPTRRRPRRPRRASARDADARLRRGTRRGARDRRDARPRDRRPRRARSRPSLEPGALVMHLAGSLGLDVFDVAARAAHRRARRRAAPAAVVPVGDDRASSGCAARGPRSPAIRRSRSSRARSGCGRSSSPTPSAAQYHAAAVVASNHLVALLGQVERLAAACGVPFEAFAPLVRVVGAERVRRRPGPGAHRPRRPRRPRDRRAAPARRSIPASATPTARWRGRSPASPAGATTRSTACSTTSATRP